MLELDAQALAYLIKNRWCYGVARLRVHGKDRHEKGNREEMVR